MSFCNALSHKLKDAVHHFDEEVQIAVDKGIVIAGNIRVGLSSPIVATIASLIPLDWVEKDRERAIEVTTTAISDMTFLNECLKENTDEHFQCYLSAISNLSPEFQNSQFFKIASTIARLLHGAKLPEHLYDLYVQTDFTTTKP